MKILLIENDPFWHRLLTHRIEEEGVDVVWVKTLMDARWTLETQTFDCLVLDLGLDDSPPDKTLPAVRRFWDGPLVVTTGDPEHCFEPHTLNKSSTVTQGLMLASVQAAVHSHRARGTISKLRPRGMFTSEIAAGAAALSETMKGFA